MRVTQKVSIVLIVSLLASFVLPFGNWMTKAVADTTHFNVDFTGYEGSSTKATAPSGMGMSNFAANLDYVIGEADTAKFISNTKSKYLQIYKSFSSPITGRVALKAKVRFGDTVHERRIFNVNASSDDNNFKVTKSLVNFGSDGRISVFESVYLPDSYNKDEWYDLKIVLDQTDSKTLQFYMNGELKADKVALNSEWDQFNYIRIGQVGNSVPNGIMELDDVKILDEAAPTPPASLVEFANNKFDTYLGPTVSSGGSVKLDDLKVYNVINGSNYITDAVVEDKDGKSLKFITTVSDSKGMNLTKENFAELLTGPIVMEANVRFEDTAVQRDIFSLRNIGNVPGVSAKFVNLFSFMPGGTIKVNGKIADRTYSTGVWYKVGVIIDNTTEKVTFYIDDIPLMAAGSDKLPVGWGSIFSVKFTQSGIDGQTGIMYLDDFRVYAGTSFTPEVNPGETPPAAVIDGWEIRHLSGAPSSQADSGQHLIAGDYIQIMVPKAKDKVSMMKVLPVSGGKTYVLDAWAKVETPSSTNIQSSVVPLVNNVPMKKNGKEIKFTSQNNTRGEKIENEWVRVRTYFEAPVEASSIRVEHIIPGPAVVSISTQLTERPEWQDVIGSFSSAAVTHPIQGDITKMFVAWQWSPIAAETEETTRQSVAPLMAMSEDELVAAAGANAMTRQYVDIHPEYEQMSRRMAILYHLTGEEEYARRAILIMQKFASTYGDVPRLVQDNDLFHAHGKYIPMDALYGYDLIYNSPQWNKLELEQGATIREGVEGWFRSSFMNLYNLHNDVYYSNITPYGIRNAMGLAVILNDPEVIRLMLPWIDAMFSGRQFHADGMWEEGTVSYGGQVTSNVIGALSLLESSYKDPEDYVDMKYGLKLDHTNLRSRWPLIDKSNDLFNRMKFPNGSTIGIHDTWTKGQRGEVPNKVTDPIYAEYLNNLELYNFGHYSLTTGDTQDATQVHLTFPPLAEGLPYSAGHYHGNHLGLILWGAGMEMLPDSGYPKGTNRYFNMSTKTHNTAWVWNKDAAKYPDRISLFTRPSLLAYDPGLRSNKAVQLVEASSPGPTGDLTEMKRRLLMMVQTEGNRSYVLDLQRLKGGDAHELFLHASEDEDSDLSTSLAVTEYPGYTVEQYMKETKREEGMPEYRNMFKDPRVGAGIEDFAFTWKGKESGSSIRTFMNGISGSEDIFSRMPMNRLTQNDNAQMGNYPGWHFYRRHLVESDEVTRFGAVYETVRESQQPIVQGVEWKDPGEGDPMSTIAVVDMGSYRDIVYLSDDTIERTYNGIQFAGKVAVLRQDKQSGSYTWGYVYGEGHIHAGAFRVQGETDLKFRAVEASGSLDGSSANTIKLDKIVPGGASLQGVWLRTEFGDKSGYGMRIESVNGDRVQVHDTPGFEIIPSGARMTYFPSNEQLETGYLKLHAGDQQYYSPREVRGEVAVEIRQPKFVRNVPTGNPDDDDSDSGSNPGGTESSPPIPVIKDTGQMDKPDTKNDNTKPATEPESSIPLFLDVAADHWAKQAIHALLAKGIIDGYRDGSFRPEGSITRAEFASLLMKLLKIQGTGSISYKDIDSGTWYYEAIAAVSSAGIASGYEDGDFKPDHTITREEAAVMTARALKLVNGLQTTKTDVNTLVFNDESDISDWAKAEINTLTLQGIMNGREGNAFAPKDTTTRAEAAKMIYYILNIKQVLTVNGE